MGYAKKHKTQSRTWDTTCLEIEEPSHITRVNSHHNFMNY